MREVAHRPGHRGRADRQLLGSSAAVIRPSSSTSSAANTRDGMGGKPASPGPPQLLDDGGDRAGRGGGPVGTAYDFTAFTDF